MEKKSVCTNCKITVSAVLHLNIGTNGAESFTWVCQRCNKRNPFRGDDYFIAKEKVSAKLTKEQIEFLPRLMQPAYCRCVVCGSRNAELHHWAPRAIFGNDECEQWPKDYLCKEHHDQWHLKVTPQLVKK